MDAKFRKQQHFSGLDGIRGIAVLLVLIFHTTYFGQASTLDNVIWRATRGMSAGVDVFFVLSGFLITGILLRERGRRYYFYNFYTKRLLRIFPLYYLMIAVSVIAPVLFPILQQNDIPLLPYWGLNYWLFLSNVWSYGPHPILGVSWSLAYEEQFYLVWPFIVAFIAFGSLVRLCLVLVAVGLISRMLLAFDLAEGIGFVLLARVDLLALGGLLACWYHSGQRSSEAEAARIAGVFFIVGMFVLAWIVIVAEGPWGPLMKSYGNLAVGCVTASAIVLAVFCQRRHAPVNAVLSSRFLRSWGKYSYAIYLLHSPLDAVLRRVIDIETFIFPIYGIELPMQIAYWTLIGTISWAAGWLSWHLFEVHFLRLRPKLLKKDISGAPKPNAAVVTK
jgi:peptidoglycan/LPS O-acetylase OafA/YrhL